MSEEQHIAEQRVAELVKRNCLRGQQECSWPECGCDPQVSARDILKVANGD